MLVVVLILKKTGLCVLVSYLEFTGIARIISHYVSVGLREPPRVVPSAGRSSDGHWPRGHHHVQTSVSDHLREPSGWICRSFVSTDLFTAYIATLTLLPQPCLSPDHIHIKMFATIISQFLLKIIPRCSALFQTLCGPSVGRGGGIPRTPRIWGGAVPWGEGAGGGDSRPRRSSCAHRNKAATACQDQHTL